MHYPDITVWDVGSNFHLCEHSPIDFKSSSTNYLLFKLVLGLYMNFPEGFLHSNTDEAV